MDYAVGAIAWHAPPFGAQKEPQSRAPGSPNGELSVWDELIPNGALDADALPEHADGTA